MSSLAITLVCHNRPEYLKRVLDSIRANVYTGAKLFVCEDNATQAVRDVVAAIDWIPLRVEQTNLGINYANRHIYRIASMCGAEYVCAVEDDTAMAPDCLHLVRWAMERNFCMLNCFSPSTASNTAPAHVQALRMVNRFCPWVWMFKSKFFWDVLQKYWMLDQRGWDWSMLTTIQSLGIPVLEPILSRSINIGREGGVNYTPELYDKEFAAHVASSSTEYTGYNIIM